MQNAILDGKLVVAAQVAKDYLMEKQVRRASAGKALRCPDPACKGAVLYRHGTKRAAHFAHTQTRRCDYADFDAKDSSEVRAIRLKLYEHLRGSGFPVHLEVKVLPHHYTHLLYEQAGGPLALEIGTPHTGIEEIDALDRAYKAAGIAYRWVLLGDTPPPKYEEDYPFLGRLVLNELEAGPLLVINWDGLAVAQCRLDLDEYSFRGREIQSENYPEIYIKYGTLEQITFTDGGLSLPGFTQEYARWHTKKQSAFQKKVAKLEEEWEAQRQFDAFKREWKANQRAAAKQADEEQRRQEVLPMIDQQEIQVRDSTGQRWVKCECCGLVAPEDQFSSLGGAGRINLGTCQQCNDRNRRGHPQK